MSVRLFNAWLLRMSCFTSSFVGRRGCGAVFRSRPNLQQYTLLHPEGTRCVIANSARKTLKRVSGGRLDVCSDFDSRFGSVFSLFILARWFESAPSCGYHKLQSNSAFLQVSFNGAFEAKSAFA